MIVGSIYFLLGSLLLLVTLKVLIPGLGGMLFSIPLAFAAMALQIFMPQLILIGGVTTGATWLFGGLQSWPGQVGLAMHLFSWAALGRTLWRMHRAELILDGVPLAEADHPFLSGLPEEMRRLLHLAPVKWYPALTFRIEEMRTVKVTRGVVFREISGKRLRLDIYHPPGSSRPSPCVVYIHGGAWVSGTRRQARFMCYQLARAGWTVFAISYRFAPRYPLPAAIEDCKAAVAWVKAKAPDYGGDPSLVVAIGGSAGGHLASMVALSEGEKRFQPGFEEADTTVQGAVVFYGVSDFVRPFEESPNPVMAIALERAIFRTPFRSNRDLYKACQPITYCAPSAPPLLLVHGQNDFVVPIDESRRFAERLRSAGAREVHVLEVPTGLHAYDVSPSPLQQRTMRVVFRFLDGIRLRYQAGDLAIPDSSPENVRVKGEISPMIKAGTADGKSHFTDAPPARGLLRMFAPAKFLQW